MADGRAIGIDDLDPAVYDQIIDRLGQLALLNTLTASLLRGPIARITTATYTPLDGDVILSADFAGTVTLTLPMASVNEFRAFRVRTVQNQTVVSDDSNVEPLAGGAPGTAILAGTAGSWADLVSDGTSWVITAGS